MFVRLLGTAAGGGFPQWNCSCRNCREVRSVPARATARTQTSVALSADGLRWFLIGASPDIRTQIESFPPLYTHAAVRGSAIEGLLLAGADLDHVLGLFLLREGGELKIHATPSVALCPLRKPQLAASPLPLLYLAVVRAPRPTRASAAS